MLTKRQREDFYIMLRRINNNQNCLKSSQFQQWGKTYMLNELSLTLQSMGHYVYILTNTQCEHFGNNRLYTNYIQNKGIRFCKNDVIIVDEFRYSRFQKLIKRIPDLKLIPIIGYVDFKS